ncbi:MAG: hypothetical protein IPO97_09370 [Sphingomonadales bacterium]|nr:hypothetical protein [Sphingomonadales bacterium]
MVEVLEHPPVLLNGREIDAAAIAAEVQNHPAPDAHAAWEAAARALAFRQLLLDEADRFDIMAVGLDDAEGRTLADDDAKIEALLEQEVRCPEADEATAALLHPATRNGSRRQPWSRPNISCSPPPDDDLASWLATGDARMAIKNAWAEPCALLNLHRSIQPAPQGTRRQSRPDRPGQTVNEFEAALFGLVKANCIPIRCRPALASTCHPRRAPRRGPALPLELVQDKIAQYLEEASWRRAVSQYLTILASQAKIEGIDIGGADGPLVQ